jgi:GDP-4-dehydro-6-deoxy-D-mannose reductase
MRLLITGVSGFVGRHVLAFLREEQPAVEVFGLARRAAPDLGCACLAADLEDAPALHAALERARPERVLHLAAQSSPRLSFEQPARTLRANVEGTLNLLEALRARAPRARVLVVGSGEEYGRAEQGEQPLGEDTPLRPLSPYAASKVAQSYLALQYHLSYGLDVVRTRTFNHTGPGRGRDFAESSFARQIAAVERGLRKPPLAVGNLDSVRDFCDVRDVVRAYWALFERGRAGEVYNVCSGRAVRIRAVLERLESLARVPVGDAPDPRLMRPADIPALVGDPSRLRAATGWQARIPLERTLAELLDDWRGRPDEELRDAA